jgi:hypothetical protein
MSILRKTRDLRHSLAISALALIMCVLASAAAKAAVPSKPKPLADPVISSMTWEQPVGVSADDGLGDIPVIFCNGNCPKNCNSGCDGNCNNNCNGNC